MLSRHNTCDATGDFGACVCMQSFRNIVCSANQERTATFPPSPGNSLPAPDVPSQPRTFPPSPRTQSLVCFVTGHAGPFSCSQQVLRPTRANVLALLKQVEGDGNSSHRDLLVLCAERTMALGPGPDYVNFWYSPGCGLERLDAWDNFSRTYLLQL